MITCYLRYVIDPFKLKEFEHYGKLWIPLVEKFGGKHHGYFLPSEGANNIALALFTFASLAKYEDYRLKSMQDSECQAAFKYAEQKTRSFFETQNRLATEHALLDDAGKGEGVKDPSEKNGQGLVAGRFAVIHLGKMTAEINKNYTSMVESKQNNEASAKEVTCGTCHRGKFDPPAYVPPPEPEHEHHDGPQPAGEKPPIPH